MKIECCYKRVPLKRGKASQTYIESTKEKRAAAAAQNEFIASKLSDDRHARKDGELGSNTFSSSLSLSSLNQFQSDQNNAMSQHPMEGRATSEPHYVDPSRGPVFNQQGSDTNIIFQSNFGQHNNRAANSKPDAPEFNSGTQTPKMMFEQSMSPSSNWFFNLSHNFADQQPQQQPQPIVPAESQSETGGLQNRETTQFPPTDNEQQPHPILPMAIDRYSNRFQGNFTHYSPIAQAVRQSPPPSFPSRETTRNFRYPILKSISAQLQSYHIPLDLAEDLLESYFSHSTHVLAYLVRKSSVLSTTNPRPTTPALLLSFLLVAAHSSDHPKLTGVPGTRKTMLDRLTDLTISQLSTLHHLTPKLTPDDIITYIQLGTVVSASEFKGYSVRFWAAAWALSKEQKLNIENPTLPEETREEQRRTWWLLYMVDRHLGLCFNRPLAILDSESTLLYRPIDDSIWESDAVLTPAELDPTRIKGLCHFVTGQGIFGYFLPLMSILGLLLELHHLQQNPVMSLTEIDASMKPSIRSYLDQYMDSLKNWTPRPCNNTYETAWLDYAYQLAHVLYILSVVPWDPLELMNSPDSFVQSLEFGEAVNHAISASQHATHILTTDPELMFMPLFYGIYLFENSLVLLLLVDRVDHDVSRDVYKACETIVHAHEVCVVTLDTEYQRNFRRVMRGTINLLNSEAQQTHTPSSTKSASPASAQENRPAEERFKREREDARRRRKDVLGLYRWTSGGHGLAV